METTRMAFFIEHMLSFCLVKKKEYMVTLLDEPMHITREKKNYCMLTFLSVGVADKKMLFLRRVLLP